MPYIPYLPNIPYFPNMPYQTDHTHHTYPTYHTTPPPHHRGEGDSATPPPHHRGEGEDLIWGQYMGPIPWGVGGGGGWQGLVHIYIYHIYLVGGLNPPEKYDDSIFHRENDYIDYIPKLVFPH